MIERDHGMVSKLEVRARRIAGIDPGRRYLITDIEMDMDILYIATDTFPSMSCFIFSLSADAIRARASMTSICFVQLLRLRAVLDVFVSCRLQTASQLGSFPALSTLAFTVR